MAERNPFDQQPKAARAGVDAGRKLGCEEWESLLADALDGVLPETDGAAFHAHGAECKLCAALLAEARQGQEWMQFLQVEPEMPADMMERILSKTSGAVAERPLAVYGAPIPAGGPHVMGIPMRRMVWDTRLMMTAAMAFFSIALTLNLAGVRLTDLRLSALTPASLESNLTRQFYGAKSSVVRYYDNLRFVYEVESKMRELRQNEDAAPAPATEPKPQEQPPVNPPANHKTGGKLETVPTAPTPEVIRGRAVLASAAQEAPATGDALEERMGRVHGAETRDHKGVKTLVVLFVDQAERGVA